MKKVGIIGASGFIGSHVTKTFLENGFEVKASTTDISNKGKYLHLMDLESSDRLHIAELDVTDKTTLTEFVSDCDIVIHGGTPFQLDFKDPKTELMDPTIKGTENFLEVINGTPRIQKVVLIASVAAWNTNFPLPAGGKEPTDTFSEKETPFMSAESHPYAQAKFIANQTVEKFLNTHPDLDCEITSVSPVMVMGKSLSQREDSTSTGLQFLVKNKIAPNPFIQMFYDEDVLFAIVDVEDVASAIFNAATHKGLHGKNYLLTSESYKVSDVSAMLNHKVPKEKGSIIYQNKPAQTDLEVQFRPVQETLNNYSN